MVGVTVTVAPAPAFLKAPKHKKWNRELFVCVWVWEWSVAEVGVKKEAGWTRCTGSDRWPCDYSEEKYAARPRASTHLYWSGSGPRRCGQKHTVHVDQTVNLTAERPGEVAAHKTAPRLTGHTVTFQELLSSEFRRPITSGRSNNSSWLKYEAHVKAAEWKRFVFFFFKNWWILPWYKVSPLIMLRYYWIDHHSGDGFGPRALGLTWVLIG